MCDSIKNVGKGPAFHVVASISGDRSLLGPVRLASTVHCTIVPAGAQHVFNDTKFGAVIEAGKGREYAITMSAWDAQDTWHQFRYTFAALPLRTKLGDAVPHYGLLLTVAPGTTMLRRAHRKLSGRRFRWALKAKKLPRLGDHLAYLLGWRAHDEW
jgi:hypothetical protein